MKPSRVRFTAAALGTAVNISALQSPAGTSMLINGTLASGGVATFGGNEATIGIASGGDDTALTWLVVGTAFDGRPLQEAVRGGSGSTVSTMMAFKTVTSITSDRQPAGNNSAGWTSGYASKILPIDYCGMGAEVGLQLLYGFGSTGTVTVQATREPCMSWRGKSLTKGRNPNWFGTPFEMVLPMLPSDFLALPAPFAGATITTSGAITGPITGIRMIIVATAVVGTIELWVNTTSVR